MPFCSSPFVRIPRRPMKPVTSGEKSRFRLNLSSSRFTIAPWELGDVLLNMSNSTRVNWKFHATPAPPLKLDEDTREDVAGVVSVAGVFTSCSARLPPTRKYQLVICEGAMRHSAKSPAVVVSGELSSGLNCAPTTSTSNVVRCEVFHLMPALAPMS